MISQAVFHRGSVRLHVISVTSVKDKPVDQKILIFVITPEISITSPVKRNSVISCHKRSRWCLRFRWCYLRLFPVRVQRLIRRNGNDRVRLYPGSRTRIGVPSEKFITISGRRRKRSVGLSLCHDHRRCGYISTVCIKMYRICANWRMCSIHCVRFDAEICIITGAIIIPCQLTPITCPSPQKALSIFSTGHTVNRFSKFPIKIALAAFHLKSN